MTYKIPDDVREFRGTVPVGKYFVVVVTPVKIRKFIRAHREIFDTFDEAVEAGDKLVTETQWAVVFYQNDQTHAAFLIRICDGTKRNHSLLTTKEKQEYGIPIIDG